MRMCLNRVKDKFETPEQKGRWGYKVMYLVDGEKVPWWKFWKKTQLQAYYYRLQDRYEIGKPYTAEIPVYKDPEKMPYQIGFHAHTGAGELHEFMDHIDKDKDHEYKRTVLVKVWISEITAQGTDRAACMGGAAEAFVGLRQTIVEIIRQGK